MSIITPRIASGFPEYLPEEQIEFNRLLDIIKYTYEKYGFSPIDTPDLELSEVLLAKGGGETDQQVYEFRRGKNDFCMRFDLTVPLARYAAQHQAQLTFPFRRYHIGKVHRAERAQAGRFREFYQCDIDVIGTESVVVDAEIPAVINEVFEKFNFGEFVIRLNNRKILNGFFAELNLDDDDKVKVMRIVDKVEKITGDEFRTMLKEAGLSADQIEKIVTFINIKGGNDQILASLEELRITNSEFAEGLEGLKTLIKTIRTFGVPEKRFQLDLRIARGLDYYTGTVYETKLTDHPELGSVCSGGRFDNLAEHYTETKLPGVGISIGLSRLFYKLREIGLIKADRKSPADLVVLPISENEFDYAAKIAGKLRDNGISTIFYSEPTSFKKKMKYADAMGFLGVIIVGEEERNANTVTVKNMETGRTGKTTFDQITQITTVEELAEILQNA